MTKDKKRIAIMPLMAVCVLLVCAVTLSACKGETDFGKLLNQKGGAIVKYTFSNESDANEYSIQIVNALKNKSWQAIATTEHETQSGVWSASVKVIAKSGGWYSQLENDLNTINDDILNASGVSWGISAIETISASGGR